jgi:hypothetical protein
VNKIRHEDTKTKRSRSANPEQKYLPFLSAAGIKPSPFFVPFVTDFFLRAFVVNLASLLP